MIVRYNQVMKHFADTAQIFIKAGNGGDGAVTFRREKFIPKGGPDGGNGADGGDVYIRATSKLHTLYDFTHKHKFLAENGEPGRKRKQFGKNGEDLFLEVPVGTIVYRLIKPDEDTEVEEEEVMPPQLEKIADLTKDGQVFLAAKGGVGGRGNDTYKSATNQTPMQYQEGGVGEEYDAVLELKVVADVGLIGLPNAGKSTLLSVITDAKPEIADYPFTTLSPNLGVMKHYDERYVLADLPGLIEGASQGKGLGDEFLRHVERTRVLVHLIDPLYEDPIASYKIIRNELGAYSKKLLEKPELVVLTKKDAQHNDELFDNYSHQLQELGVDRVMNISAVAHGGLEELKLAIVDLISQAPEEVQEESIESSNPVFTIDDLKSF